MGRCWKDGQVEPICLAEDTRIATPNGEVPVRDLTPGALVWTLDANGARVAAPLTTVGHVPAPPSHAMVHVVLSDGRSVSASPGHPTCAAARVGASAVSTVADITRGHAFDHATVSTSERVPYSGTETWDVLPSGATGCYWANGVLLGSTLR